MSGGERVSALLTCYNAAWCVDRALDGLLAQTRAPDEIVVTDDGSTDDTVERIVSRLGTRAKLLRLPHQGLTRSRAAAFAAASGDWLAMLDADDRWLPEKLERELAAARRHPDARWIVSDAVYVSEAGVLRESWLSHYFDPVRELSGDLLPALIERSFVLPSASLVAADAYRASGGFDPSFVYSQDYDLFLRLAARCPGVVLPDRLAHYFASPGGMSRRLEERHRDNLRLMERIERGELRREPRIERSGARRVAALSFDVGMICMRSGRIEEARGLLGRAAGRGSPWPRRAVALAAAMLPAFMVRAFARLGWVRGAVGRVAETARRLDARLDPPGPGDGAA